MQWNTVPIANTTCDRYWCDVMMKATCGDDGRQEVTGDRHPGPCRKPCTHASVGKAEVAKKYSIYARIFGIC